MEKPLVQNEPVEVTLLVTGVFEKLEVSDRQWRDILGVLKTRAGELDLAYLRQWAGELTISDLLERALQEAQ